MIEWIDPPTKAGTAPNGRYASIVTDLQTRPGQWALVGRNEHCSLAKALRDRGCETRTVTTTRPRVDVYAKWPETQPCLTLDTTKGQ